MQSPSQDEKEAQSIGSSNSGADYFTAQAVGHPTSPAPGTGYMLAAPHDFEVADRREFKGQRRLLTCLGAHVLISYIPLLQQEGDWPEFDLENSPCTKVSGALQKPRH